MENAKVEKQTEGPWLAFFEGNGNVWPEQVSDLAEHMNHVREATEGNIKYTYVPLQLAADAPVLHAENERLKSLNAELLEALKGMCGLWDRMYDDPIAEDYHTAMKVIQKNTQP